MNSRLTDIASSLEIVRHDLEILIAPELTRSTPQSTLALINKLLRMLAMEIAHAESADPQTEVLMLLERSAASSESGSRDVWRTYDALAAARERRDTGSSDTAWDASYRESGAGGGPGQPTAPAATTLTAETLAEYVRTRLPGGALAEVDCLERLPGGYSKGTYIAGIRRPEGPEGWVLRCDLPFTPLNTRVCDEFALLSALYKLGLPVPEPLWFEPDASRLGAPLIAVRKIEGSGDMAHWTQDGSLARRVAREAAALLAAIHSIQLSSLPPLQTDAPGCHGATPAEVREHVYKFWQSVRLEPDPLVELIFHWLRQHTPDVVVPCLVHGDYGLHNLLVHDGRISAVLDWEFAHVGDPRKDLAYARPFVEQVMPWAEFLAEYSGAGGIAGDDAAIRFYSVLGYLRNALGCMKVQHALRNGNPNIDAKFVYVGRSYAQQILRNAARLTGML